MPHTAITARDIMTTKVITVSPDQDLFDVIALLIKHKISGAPVVDRSGRYLGVFTERTSISLLMDAITQGTPTNRIEAFIDCNAVTIGPETDLLTMAQILKDTHYRRLPVLQHGKVIGLVSRRDILRASLGLMEIDRPHEPTFLYLSLIHDRNEVPVV